MQLKPVVKESLRLYKKNFAPLMLCLLVQGVLRFIALTPLLFLADKALAPLALLALPLYLLIALPARQNVALALQDMIGGGSVFSLRLLSTADYARKLLRGLKGTLCMLLWSALTLTGVTEVISFDENAVVLHTALGMLTVHGSALQLRQLSPEGGQVAIDGTVSAMIYEDRKEGGWLRRLLK